MTSVNPKDKRMSACVLILWLLAAGTSISRADSTPVDVPTAEVVAAADTTKEETKAAWWNPLNWKEMYHARTAEKEQLESYVAQLKASRDKAIGELAFHDQQVSALEEQNTKNVAYLESIIDQLKGEVESLQNRSASLDKAIQEYQDKDGSLMYVEGCWVPLKTGQLNPQ